MGPISSIFNSNRREARKRFEESYKRLKARKEAQGLNQEWEEEQWEQDEDDPRYTRQGSERHGGERARQESARHEEAARQRQESARQEAALQRQASERQEAIRLQQEAEYQASDYAEIERRRQREAQRAMRQDTARAHEEAEYEDEEYQEYEEYERHIDERQRHKLERQEAERQRQEAEYREAERQQIERQRQWAERQAVIRQRQEEERQEAERRRQEAERQEAERQRQRAERQEMARKRQEAQRQEAERIRQVAKQEEEERIRQRIELEEAERRQTEQAEAELSSQPDILDEAAPTRQLPKYENAEPGHRMAESEEPGTEEAERERKRAERKRKRAEREEAEFLSLQDQPKQDQFQLDRTEKIERKRQKAEPEGVTRRFKETERLFQEARLYETVNLGAERQEETVPRPYKEPKAMRLWIGAGTARLEFAGAGNMSVAVDGVAEMLYADSADMEYDDEQDDSILGRLQQWVEEKLTKRTQQVASLVLFVVICYAFTGVVGGVYSDANDRNHVNAWSQQRFDDFYALPEGWLDMVFLGSSHSFTTFDPAQFEGHWNAFQLGMPLQTPDSSFFTLLEVYNYQRPDIVVMELYWNVMNRDFVPAQVETFFRVLANEELKALYIDEVLPLNEQVKYNIEAIRFQDAAFAFANAWIRNFARESELFYEEGFVEDRPVGVQYYRALGYVYSSYVMTQSEFERIQRTPARRVNFQISPRQQHFLEEMVRLTEYHGSQLIFVTAPISNVSFVNILNYEDIHAEISGFAEAHGIPYLDFHKRNVELGLFADYMFLDHGHLNHTGAEIASAYFIEWLTGVLRQ
ncbi:MAG: hypothetical protein FWD96_03115 [Defluviitaleaceae bacterium]|nr:hypothetical protein [Defluviitaleaceae bacterium]